MNRPQRGPSRPWSDADVGRLLGLANQNVSQADMARALGRTISSVEGKLRLVREGQIAAGHGANAYDKPDRIAMDDAAHTRAVLAAGGFRWLRPDIAERFYALEIPPPRKVEFWRAA